MLNAQLFVIKRKKYFIFNIFCRYMLGGDVATLTALLGSLFNKVVGHKACNFIKKRLQHRCFSVKFAKFLRAPILKNTCEWLFLKKILFYDDSQVKGTNRMFFIHCYSVNWPPIIQRASLTCFE